MVCFLLNSFASECDKKKPKRNEFFYLRTNQMPSPKKFERYAIKLAEAISFIEEDNIKRALTILKKLQENAAKAGSKSKASASRPKRPLSNYMLFAQANREEAKASLGSGAKPTDIMRKLGEMWQEVKDTWTPSAGVVKRSSSVKSKNSNSSKKSKKSDAKAKKPAAAKPKAKPKAKKAKGGGTLSNILSKF